MPQVDGNIKVKRGNILNEINLKNQHDFRNSRIGKTDELLCEEIFVNNDTEYFAGYTKEYVKIAVPKMNFKTNDIVKGKIREFLTEEILLMDPYF